MDEKTTPEAGTTNEGFVEVEDATDTEIEGFLKELRTTGSTKEAETQTEPEQAQDTDDSNAAASESAPDDANTPAPQEEQQEVKTEEAKPEPKANPTPKQPTPEEQYQAMKRQLDGLELLVRRRTQDIANIRKQLAEEAKPIKQRIEAEAHNNQYEAIRDVEALRENERKQEKLDEAERNLVQDVEARKVLTAHVKPDDGSLDEMVACLAADGIPEEHLSRFRTNPISLARPETIIQIAKRAKAERVAKQLYSVALDLFNENKKLKGKPQAVLNKVQQALKQTPAINGSNGSQPNPRRLQSSAVESMSDAELQEAARRLRGS